MYGGFSSEQISNASEGSFFPQTQEVYGLGTVALLHDLDGAFYDGCDE